MTTLKNLICGLTLACVLTAVSICAHADNSSTEAEVVANKAIAQLAAWQNKGARKTLQGKESSLGATPEFKVAWTLLEIQEAADKGKAASADSTKGFSQAAKNSSAGPAGKYWEGEFLYQQKKNKEANTAWQSAAKQAAELVSDDFTNATAQFYLGAAQVRQKKFEPARKALTLAARGGFDEAMVNHQIGLSYLFAEQWQEAVKAFDLGLSVNPRYAPMYFWRAMAWEKLGRKDNMLLDLDQFVKLAPKAPEAAKARAILKSSGG